MLLGEELQNSPNNLKGKSWNSLNDFAEKSPNSSNEIRDKTFFNCSSRIYSVHQIVSENKSTNLSHDPGKKFGKSNVARIKNYEIRKMALKKIIILVKWISEEKLWNLSNSLGINNIKFNKRYLKIAKLAKWVSERGKKL